HYYQEHKMNQRCDDCPEKYQDATNTGNCAKHCVDDRGHNVKEKPSTTENYRLHRVKAHKTIVLFEDIKNDAADHGMQAMDAATLEGKPVDVDAAVVPGSGPGGGGG